MGRGGGFGSAVKVVRARYNIKQWKLAHRLGWQQTGLYRIEAGSHAASEAERGAIAHAFADLAKRPFDEVVAMLEEEERRG